MRTKTFRAFFLALLLVMLAAPQPVPAAPQALALPLFRFPVVPGVVISGYFDHNPASGAVTFYNGRTQASGSAGFYFSCTTPNMYDWVGCEDNVSGEPGCANNRELWYDGHKGIDYEYASNWHTGAACDPNRFSGITMRVYAPAAGRVSWAGYDSARPGNGWHIRIKHDVNRNGSYDDDNLRSNFLHFTANALAVSAGQTVAEGQYLGLGGSTGYSSSPHLHFEVQRSSDNFTRNVWSVDPYGWTGSGADPWPYANEVLWRYELPRRGFIPQLFNQGSAGCPGCGQLILNGGFEQGSANWGMVGPDVITNTSDPNLPLDPFSGSWLAWLGGRDNAQDAIFQDFAVPRGVTDISLRYRVAVGTEETAPRFDFFYVRLRTPNGDLIQEVDALENGFQPQNDWEPRQIGLPVLLSWQGQTVRLSFEGTTDGSLKTNFYVDEVSITATGP